VEGNESLTLLHLESFKRMRNEGGRMVAQIGFVIFFVRLSIWFREVRNGEFCLFVVKV
jgi:hypothetical protein